MPFVLLLVGLISVTASAEQQWFSRHSEGWFWYESIPEPEEQTKNQPVTRVSSYELSASWIRKNIGQYLDRAIDAPSKKNVSAYLYLNKIVKDKAERFAHVGKQIIESDPYLDENVRRPISPVAARLKDDIAYKAKESVLKKISKIAGLVFYYKSSCPLCHVQAKTVLLLQMNYGFEVIPISTDGGMIDEFPNSRVELSPPDALHILSYPALFLMRPPGNIKLVRQGVLSFTALVDRLVEVANEQQWIDDREYTATKITGTHPLSSLHYPNNELFRSLSKALKDEQ